MSSPWVDLNPDIEVADWEFVCPVCNLVSAKHRAVTLGRYVVCGDCGE